MIVFFLLLFTNVILRSEVAGSISDEENVFRSINHQIQDAVNKIFVLLGLSKNLAVKYDNRLLLALHASLKKSSEKKYTTYKRLCKMAKLDEEYKVQTNNSLFLLDKPINEIIKEDYYLMYNSGRKSTSVQSESESKEIPENPEEVHLVLKDYLQNVGLADIAKPFKRITEIADIHEHVQRAIRRNFKVWKAKNSSELLEETRRVFNGQIVPVNKFPFLASIHVDGEFVCTGSIISREMIITAASCLQAAYYNPNYLKDKPGSVTIRVGSDYSDREGDVIGVVSIHINPLYRASTLRNNLAIVRIKKHLHLRKKNKRLRRITYKKESPGAPPAPGTKILFLGWGDKDTADSGAVEDNRLRYASLSVIDLQKCMETYTTTYVSDTNFCAGKSGKSAGACQRDIGGPAVLNSQLVGVVSFSPPVCGTTDASTVFTSIAYNIDWIDSIVSKDKRKLLPPTVGDNFMTLGPTTYVTNDDELQAMHTTKAKTISPQSKTIILRQKKNEIDTLPRKTDARSNYSKAMQLLSYALRQIMKHSYELVDDKLFIPPELGPTADLLLLNNHSLANLSYLKNTPYLKLAVRNNPSLINVLSEKKRHSDGHLHHPRQFDKNEGESDEDNYESDEKGLSIEYKPTTFTDVTVNEESENLLQNEKFVKTNLEPLNLKKQSPDFESYAEDFLLNNFMKGHISPTNSKTEINRIKSEIDEYGKPAKLQDKKGSNELVVMLLKQSTIKDISHRFGVTNNNDYGDLNEKSDIRGFVTMTKDDYVKQINKKQAYKKNKISVSSTEQRNKRLGLQTPKTNEPFSYQDTEQHMESQNENENILQLVDEDSIPSEVVTTNEDFSNNDVTRLTTAATTSIEEYVFFRGRKNATSNDNYYDSRKSGRRSILDYLDLS